MCKNYCRRCHNGTYLFDFKESRRRTFRCESHKDYTRVVFVTTLRIEHVSINIKIISVHTEMKCVYIFTEVF